MAVNKRYDIVVFGASGYTGQYVVEEIARISKEEDLTFAVSGRNKKKLETVLITAGKYTGMDLSSTATIIADVSDIDSLNKMASLSRVVINCVGPYRFYGEQVVRACVENGAHHVDVSGEPQYLERMAIKYHDSARENKVFVIGACGFDSIPCDMGCAYLLKHFKGDVNSIESYLDFESTAPSSKRINNGTWQSAVHGLAHSNELKPLRKELFKEKLPKFSYPLKFRGYVHKNPLGMEKWCIPFFGSDRSIVKRSQYHRYTEEKKRPVQMHAYFNSGSLIATIFTIIFGAMFGVMTKFGFTRKLLEKFPSIFSLGFITTEGPDRKHFDKTKFSMTFIGEGWDNYIDDTEKQHDAKPNKTMKVVVNGGEPGYLTTSMCIVQCAVVLLKDRNQLPPGGGVHTTSSAFSDTSLLERLHQHGLKFTIKQ